MKKNKLFILMVLVATFVIGIATVQAEGIEPYPSYTVSSVTADESVTILTRDFPADTDFIIRMKSLDEIGDYLDVAKFNTQTGGAFAATFPIPAELVGKINIGMLISNDSGIEIPSTFENINMSVSAPKPLGSCDYSVLPSFSIDSVVKGKSVTVETGPFPVNQSFNVYMGYYAAGVAPKKCTDGACPTPEYPWNPYWLDITGLSVADIMATYGYGDLLDPTTYAPFTFPNPAPFCWPGGEICNSGCGPNGCASFDLGAKSKSKGGLVPAYFVATKVGEYESGDGSSQIVSYDIPEHLKGFSPIIIRFEDKGSCGFYAYNFFWNADFPVAAAGADVPTVEIELINAQ